MNIKAAAFDDCEAIIKANIIITLFTNVSLKKIFNENSQQNNVSKHLN